METTTLTRKRPLVIPTPIRDAPAPEIRRGSGCHHRTFDDAPVRRRRIQNADIHAVPKLRKR